MAKQASNAASTPDVDEAAPVETPAAEVEPVRTLSSVTVRGKKYPFDANRMDPLFRLNMQKRYNELALEHLFGAEVFAEFLADITDDTGAVSWELYYELIDALNGESGTGN